MESRSLYTDIAQRTQGDIYIGVVGPVRTGKSTFIKKFMESLVVPNIQNPHKKERTVDELPQSAAGRTIMTTEPKFIPDEAVEVVLDGNAAFKVRMIDCVGYIVPSALGYIEDEMPRMVNTPWFSEEIPFNMAAEIGTQKVINEHSTIGLVITTDGSIGEIPRAEYELAEERVISELKAIDKPFVVLLNSTDSNNVSTILMAQEMEKKYEVPVMPINCLRLDEPEIKRVIEKVLFEFPIRQLDVYLPPWIDALDDDFWLKKSLYGAVMEKASGIRKIREIRGAVAQMQESDNVKACRVSAVDLGKGSARIDIEVSDDMFFKVIAETTGITVFDEGELITVMRDLSKVKSEYEKISDALADVAVKGYGIVSPSIDELRLEEPEIVRHGGQYGVKLKASAPSIHMIRAEIETEVSPIVGSEKQSEELVKYLLDEFEEDPKKIWESNIFGKSLHELVNEGLHNKLYKMPDDARDKMQETLQRIINEGSGGLICIIL